MQYILMHRELPVAALTLDVLSHISAIGDIYHIEHLPVGTVRSGVTDQKLRFESLGSVLDLTEGLSVVMV